MLVLSRRLDERTLLKVPGLDQEIEVRVLRIQGSTVRLGFIAPPRVLIVRAELCNSRAPPAILEPLLVLPDQTESARFRSGEREFVADLQNDDPRD